MKGCSIGEFIDDLFSCSDVEYIYKGRTHILSVWKNTDATYELCDTEYIGESCHTTIFDIVKPSLTECIAAYENATIYDNRTIYEAEKEIVVLFA